MSTAELSSKSQTADAPLLIPRPSKPWDDALRIVGHGEKFHNDFTLVKDGEGTWHCIGSGGRDGSLDTLFHAVGASLHEPFEYLPKITSQTDPEAVHMWAPFAIRKDDETVFLYFSHLRGSLDKYMKDRDLWDWGTQFELRLMVSKTPDLRAWVPHAAPGLERGNVVFRAPTVRDPCIFWDEQHQRYFMYYSALIPATGGDGGLEGAIRVRTSKDLIYWSAARTAMTTPPGYTNSESAFVLLRDGLYYLWVCGYNYGRMSLYISDTPFYFGDPVDNRIMEQSGHTPEIVTEEGIDYMACAHIGPGDLKGSPSDLLFGVHIQPIEWFPANTEEASKVYGRKD
ncbi:MAG: hypothetical protein HN368_05900 [Spirochaetales bacterium]|nr:hypothetical protein [Spirochaetales bacterium]